MIIQNKGQNKTLYRGKNIRTMPKYPEKKKAVFLETVAVLTCVLFYLNLPTLRAQIVTLPTDSLNYADLYQSRKLQLEFLLTQTVPPDSFAYQLMEESEYFARQKDWATALSLLEEAISDLNSPIGAESSDTSALDASLDRVLTNYELNPPPAWEWSLEFGSDFSRQEYEISYIETDSLMLEQLNNPFLGLRLAGSGDWKSQRYRISQYLRSDQQYFQYSSFLALEAGQFTNYWRISLQNDLFINFPGETANYLDNQLNLYWSPQLSEKTNLSTAGQMRFKKTLSADTVYGDIVAANLRAALRYFLRPTTWLEIAAWPSLYREEQWLGLRYTQFLAQMALNYRRNFHRYFTLKIEQAVRNFQSRVNGESYRNRYAATLPRLEWESPVAGPLGFATRLEGELRRYQTPDATYSNYNYYSLDGQIKYYFSELQSIGIGYVQEGESHFARNSNQEELIRQEDFQSRGVSVSLDFFNFNGFILSFNYRFLNRRYPHARGEDLLGYYSNRRVHSVQALGYIPLNRHWQIQFFANYDNDQDREKEFNDNRSAIFNLGLIYKF